MCHMSHVTCHVSPVKKYIFHFSFLIILQKKNGKSGGARRWRVCYQRGLPRLVTLPLLTVNIALNALLQYNTVL